MGRGRVILVATVLLLPLGALEARLLQLQVINRPAAGETPSNGRSLEVAPAPRGKIFDRNGKVLAEDRRSFDLFVLLDEFEKDPELPEEVATVCGPATSADDVREAIQAIYRQMERQFERRPERERVRLYKKERRAPYPLLRDIPFKAAILIETNPDRFPGCIVREGLKRVYPFGAVGSHLIGYLGRVSADHLCPRCKQMKMLRICPDCKIETKPSEYDKLLEKGFFTDAFADMIGEEGVAHLVHRGVFMEEMIGRAGVEDSYNEILRGKPGLLFFERESGKSHETMELVASTPGQDVELTIDLELQRFVEQQLADVRTKTVDRPRAAAVVMDPFTGEILAMASNRLYDPNHLLPFPRTKEVRAAVEEYLRKEGEHPLLSRAYQDQYQLGSVFKVVTATAGLEMHLISTGTIIECRGKFSDKLAHFS